MWQPILSDEEGGGHGYDKDAASYAFADQAVRLGFVRKVLGLVAAQLAVTAGITAVFVLSAPVRGFAAAHPWLLWLALGLSLALLVTLTWSQKARRQHPLNLVMLLAFTLCESLLLGMLSATLDTPVVLLAVAITAGVVFALSLFAVQTKVDLTPSGGALLSLLLTLLLASILQSFIHVTWLQLFLSAGGALLFSAYLVVDMQLLLGSPHASAALSPDEYVHGALSLYLDIIQIFTNLLRLLHELSRQT